MNNLKLSRKEHNIKKCLEMISTLKNFLKEDTNSQNINWMKNLETIINFQEETGSFKLVPDYNMPSDAKVEFCHIPTYICTAILMKAYLTGDSELSKKIEKPLIKGLTISTSRNLTGHGYESLKGQIEALNIFMEAGLREFIDLHHDLNPKFTKMIEDLQNQFYIQEKRKEFTGPWGENYKKDILKINNYFKTRQIFVYGTLMKGESNHHFIENSKYINTATIKNYEMYDLGYYPAIIPGEGKIIGELYEVSLKDMPSLDMLEGEGSLYIRKCKSIKETSSKKTLAYIYEFAQNLDGYNKIKSWKNYVWYVSYGSNMLYDRFRTYIEGGSFEGGGSYNTPCRDTSLPIETRNLEIQYDMYFGNYSGSWDGCGVSFLDTTKEGKALAVAYLITMEQFEHISAEENGGRLPGGGAWYEDIITLGELEGYELITITNNELRPYNKPCKDYLKTLIRGLKENWPDMSEEDINDYLDSCIRDY